MIVYLKLDNTSKPEENNDFSSLHHDKAGIAIMGAGAIGSVIGGMLARKGHKVTLVGRKPHTDEIRKNGLRISGIWGDYIIRDVNAVTEPLHEHQDVVFLTVKSFDTAEAAMEAMPIGGTKHSCCIHTERAWKY